MEACLSNIVTQLQTCNVILQGASASVQHINEDLALLTKLSDKEELVFVKDIKKKMTIIATKIKENTLLMDHNCARIENIGEKRKRETEHDIKHKIPRVLEQTSDEDEESLKSSSDEELKERYSF